MAVPVCTIDLPEYHVDTEPDHDTVGKKVDVFLNKTFSGQHIAIRCLSSSVHPDKTIDEMIEIIQKLGHDRYDPNREGDRYENNEGKHIDIFAMDFHLPEKETIFGQFTWPFYHWRKEIAGAAERIDLILIYDPSKLNQVFFTYPGREHEGERSDGWTFKKESDPKDALMAIVKIT